MTISANDIKKLFFPLSGFWSWDLCDRRAVTKYNRTGWHFKNNIYCHYVIVHIRFLAIAFLTKVCFFQNGNPSWWFIFRFRMAHKIVRVWTEEKNCWNHFMEKIKFQGHHHQMDLSCFALWKDFQARRGKMLLIKINICLCARKRFS